MYHRKRLLLAIGVGASWFTSASNLALAQQNVEQALSYNNGVLSGSARNQDIKETLISLGKAADLDIEQRYQPDKKETVSYQFSDLNLQAGLKELLRDYSYLLIPSVGTKENGGRLILLNKKNQDSIEPPYAQVATTLIDSNKTKPEEEAGEVTKNKPLSPRGLNEFKPLRDLDPNVVYEQHVAGRDYKEQIDQLEEARLQRALDALETDFDNLHQDALAELKGMNTPEATAAMLDAASGLYGKDTNLQYSAAKALWEHAADFNYKNEEANDALIKLQSIKATGIDEIAHRALADMKYIVNQNSE